MAGALSHQLLEALDLTDPTPPGVFTSVEDLDATPAPLPQAHAVRRAWQAMELGGVVYVDRTPTVYLKEVSSVDSADARRWHRALWNQGVAPILIVADPQKIHVYSGQALPPTDEEAPAAGDRLVRVLDRVSDALELRQLIRSIETGKIYADYPKHFDRERAVDSCLLRQLAGTRTALTKGRGRLPGEVVDALLTRTIFACYLIAREVICGGHFDDERLSSLDREGGLQKLLCGLGPLQARNVLYDLFERLKAVFNGSLFDVDLTEERERVGEAHMRVLQRFLGGHEVESGQLGLGFWAYDFSIIPVETISAIYESFIEAEGAKGQRETGAYYTPPHLVEFVVDTATEGWASVLGKRVLDPACGSGIFLVSLFNRMAEEWRRENPGTRNSTRAKHLARIIAENLCGVDVNETACRIASFSLYLALLDQLEPRDIHDLQKRGWRLPLLLDAPGPAPTETTGRTIIRGNFFAPELPVPKKAFDLVIGNPPWVSRDKSKDDVFLQWCADHRELPVPEKQMAHGFMWQAPEYLNPDGRGCLLLPSAVLLNKTTGDFQRAWFARFPADRVVNLSDLSFLLFTAARPATVVRFSGVVPSRQEMRIDYEAPKADLESVRGGPIRTVEMDRSQVRLSELLSLAKEGAAPLLWKSRLWGTPRDLRFLDRLRDMTPAMDHVGRPGSRKPARWAKGQGFKPLKPAGSGGHAFDRTKVIRAWWSEDHLYLSARAPFRLVVVPTDAERIGGRFRKLHRLPHKRLFLPPMVIASQGFSRIAFSDFPVLFRHSLQSICGSAEDADLLRFLAAVLNSDLASYFLFHTAASWGTERDRVLLFELLRMPFPMPAQTSDPRRSNEIVREVSARMQILRQGAETAAIGRDELVDRAVRDMQPLILEYYAVDEWENMLIEDTVGIFERSSTPPSPSSRVPTLSVAASDDRELYVRTLCALLNKWAAGSGFAVDGSVTFAPSAGLGVVTLRRSQSVRPCSQKEAPTELAWVLSRLAGLLPVSTGGLVRAPGLKVFDGDQLHIVKPLTVRFWTRTCALNDADEIASAILSPRLGRQ